MNGKDLKSHIFTHNLIPQILESVGCHHIKYHHTYWSCANYNGDNTTAISIYNTEYINVVNYTRDITSNGKLPSDLISLVGFNKQLTPFASIKFVCDIIGISYYHNFDEQLPESLRITKLIYNLQQSNLDIDDNLPLKPISQNILSYYKPYVNDMFLQDNISYETQQEFGIGYDPESNRITIPIYSEINDLIGVKGRLFQNHIEPWEQKYIYLEPCTKSKVLYGLNKTYPFIKRLGKVYIFESEKATMQAWSMGFYNTVSIGGKKISQTQIDKLTRLGVDLIFAFDKDVNKPELEDIADKFIDKINIYCIIDDKHILQEKESPTDKEENWQNLITKCIYKIK